MGDYALFLGCLIPLKNPQIEAASRMALAKLGVGVKDVPEFSCCPEPWNFKSADISGWLAAAARNLAVAEKQGLDVMTLCNGCSSTLIEAAHIMNGGGEAAETAAQALKNVGLSYAGKTKALHCVQVLAEQVGAEKVAKSVSKPLTGLRVAVHYGCHLLRPNDIVGFDDPFSPHVLDDLVEATGAESVAYEDKMDCCGSASLDSDVALGLLEDKLAHMEEAGAACTVVGCPACFEQFDLGQVELNRKRGTKHQLPVLHYLQLLALAQGASAEQVGLGRHKIKADAIRKAVAG